MPPAPFLHPENAPKSLAAGALPQTPLGELTDLLAGLRGPTSKERGGEGRGEEGKGRDFGPSQCWRQIDAPDWKFGSHTYDGHRQYFRVSVHSSLE